MTTNSDDANTDGAKQPRSEKIDNKLCSSGPSIMQWRFLSKRLHYDGTQLRSLFNYLQGGLLGDSIVAFLGSCDIPFEHMVDGEDLSSQSAIRGGDMLHFIVERFETNLFTAVCLQRLMASIHFELLSKKIKNAHSLRRDGDDLFFNDRKLSISIATVSPSSALIHFALNIEVIDVPVAAIGLKDLGIEPQSYALEVMRLFCTEIHSAHLAARKVRWVY